MGILDTVLKFRLQYTYGQRLRKGCGWVFWQAFLFSPIADTKQSRRIYSYVNLATS